MSFYATLQDFQLKCFVLIAYLGSTYVFIKNVLFANWKEQQQTLNFYTNNDNNFLLYIISIEFQF